MNEMIERAARALVRQYEIEDGLGVEAAEQAAAGDAYRNFLASVRAVLSAMREPTEAMVAAALPLVTHPTPEQREIGKKALALLPPVRVEQHFHGLTAASELVRDWQTMIDEALKEQP